MLLCGEPGNAHYVESDEGGHRMHGSVYTKERSGVDESQGLGRTVDCGITAESVGTRKML